MSVICRAVQEGDQAATQVIRRAGRCLGIIAANLVAVLSVQRILIAGGLTCLGESLLAVIREEMMRCSLAALAGQTEVAMSTMGPYIVNLGASALVITQELGMLPVLTYDV